MLFCRLYPQKVPILVHFLFQVDWSDADLVVLALTRHSIQFDKALFLFYCPVKICLELLISCKKQEFYLFTVQVFAATTCFDTPTMQVCVVAWNSKWNIYTISNHLTADNKINQVLQVKQLIDEIRCGSLHCLPLIGLIAAVGISSCW